MKLLTAVLIAIVCVTTACVPQPVPNTAVRFESSGPATVRTVNWVDRTFVIEKDNGDVIPFSPLCAHSKETLAVWQDMRVNVHYHWRGYTIAQGNEGYGAHDCFEIDRVERVK